ncbi:MAG: hypothetical protein CMB48_02080 [Euryarchaeota archaeon]|nr:hypothetical protein [Euryarchaeota archaeon]|tara:strand:+ start:1462 stop:2076 length:615 start_codon:yes stop_codon:yes gene_type:complete
MINEKELEMIPEAPEHEPEPCSIVLGRFQPFHRGHVALIEWAYEQKESSLLRIAIGSANRPQTPENPWSWEERKDMIENWKKKVHPKWNIEIIAIPDINNPPKWVEHATQYHGKSGLLLTSDKETQKLYEKSKWKTKFFELENRDTFEGWRVRETCKMLSTVKEKDSVKQILLETIPEVVIEWLMEKDHLSRLPFLGPNVEYVG